MEHCSYSYTTIYIIDVRNKLQIGGLIFTEWVPNNNLHHSNECATMQPYFPVLTQFKYLFLKDCYTKYNKI
jgi:hypothetical protein